MLTSSIEPFLTRFERRNLRVEITVADPPPQALGDPALVRIILNNLFDNAVSYATPETEVHISCGVVNDKVEFRISNSTNCLPEHVERLFEPLFRHDKSRGESGAHLGIGLTLSLEAAMVTGGMLTVRKTEAERRNPVHAHPARRIDLLVFG